MEDCTPSLMSGGNELLYDKTDSIAVSMTLDRKTQIALAQRSLRTQYPRNISICCRGVESACWGFSSAESERVLKYLPTREQDILFFVVDHTGQPTQRGHIAGAHWKEMYKTMPRRPHTGDYLVFTKDIE